MPEPQLRKTKRRAQQKTTGIKKQISFGSKVKSMPGRIHMRAKKFLSRRPHRSFRLTKRRDSKRSLAMPGYWNFTVYVLSILRSRWKVFVGLAALYAVLSVILGNMTSQDTYRQVGTLLEEAAPDVLQGSWGAVSQAGLVALSAFSGNSATLTDIQKVYMTIIVILTWLSSVWILREVVAGRRPRLRDGLYNGLAPLLSTVLVFLYLIAQLLPVGILAIVYSALSTVGVLSEGFGMYLFSAIAIVVGALTLYWMTATFIALVVVTLPGMYPGHAIKIAGDLVVGRRLRIVNRILWMLLISLVAWAIVMVPIVMLDTWLSSRFDWGWLNWLPVVPLVAMLMSSVTSVWYASYIYLLYRKVVDDDAAPA